VFQHLATQNDIETGVQCWNFNYITDQINTTGIPNLGLQTFINRTPLLSMVLTKILRNILKVPTVLTVSEFTGASIKNANSGGEQAQGFFEPDLTVEFVDVSHLSKDLILEATED
jgi:hypothetical protein